jgi:magnesium-transporting ATPase (P-type)
MLSEAWGFDYRAMRADYRARGAFVKQYMFSSSRKMMSVLVKTETGCGRACVCVCVRLCVCVCACAARACACALPHGITLFLYSPPTRARRYRLLVKGASEMVLGRCTSVVAPDGSRIPMRDVDDTHSDVSRTIVGMARNGERAGGRAAPRTQ